MGMTKIRGLPLRHVLVPVLAALLAAFVAADGSASAHSSTHVVRIRDIAFHPARLVIARGERVTWRFVDPEVSHNVRSRGHRRFRSSNAMLTGSFTRTFPHTGTYRYVCTLHPGMAGAIVVR